jgi:hypothetical protein
VTPPRKPNPRAFKATRVLQRIERGTCEHTEGCSRPATHVLGDLFDKGGLRCRWHAEEWHPAYVQSIEDYLPTVLKRWAKSYKAKRVREAGGRSA